MYRTLKKLNSRKLVFVTFKLPPAVLNKNFKHARQRESSLDAIPDNLLALKDTACLCYFRSYQNPIGLRIVQCEYALSCLGGRSSADPSIGSNGGGNSSGNSANSSGSALNPSPNKPVEVVNCMKTNLAINHLFIVNKDHAKTQLALTPSTGIDPNQPVCQNIYRFVPLMIPIVT